MNIKTADGKVVIIGEKDPVTKLQEQVDELLATVLLQEVTIQQLKALTGGE